jgi:DNA-directed RNA polymerase specialized sigma24 family protein
VTGHLVSESPCAARFPTTHWGRVLEAGDPDAPEARAAMEGLCRDYWYPLYAFVRRKGHDPETAQDLVQDLNQLGAAGLARWRRQALDWLRAELAVQSRMLATNNPQQRDAVADAMRDWRVESDLAGVRDVQALAKLPEDEQKAWRALWQQVLSLLKEARHAPLSVTPAESGR